MQNYAICITMTCVTLIFNATYSYWIAAHHALYHSVICIIILVCFWDGLVAWGLTALSAQRGYIAP